MMSTESPETSEKMEFEAHKRTLYKTVESTMQPPADDNAVLFPVNQRLATNLHNAISDNDTDCDDAIRSDMQRIPGSGGNDGMRQPNFHDQRERFYEVNKEEQPLDFSRKPVSSDKKQYPLNFGKSTMNMPITYQPSQENVGKNSYCEDSCDDEKNASCTVYSQGPEIRKPIAVLPVRRYGNDMIDKIQDTPNSRRNGPYFQGARSDECKRNRIKSQNSSGSECEFYSECSDRTHSFDSDDGPSQSRSSYEAYPSTEGKKLPHPQHAISRGPNDHSEDGYTAAKEKNDRFHIQGILGLNNQSPLGKELSGTGHQINNSVAQRKTSPQPISNFGKVNPSPSSSTTSHFVSPGSTSSRHRSLFSPGIKKRPMNVPPSRFPSGANGRLPESSGIIYPHMQAIFPPNHTGYFRNFNSPEVSGYSNLYSYPPGNILQPPFNPAYAQPHQQAALVNQGHQRQKKQRPFKDIDTSVLMSHLPDAAAALNLNSTSSPAYNSSVMKNTESGVQAVMDSSPQSPDSPSVATGSCSNKTLPQDTNGKCGRKRVRRVPVEEQNDKYFERRRRNNLSAKRSRDLRREKEDLVALSCNNLIDYKRRLEAANQMLSATLAAKEQKLEMLMALIISYREMLEPSLRDSFDDFFRLVLPRQQERS